MSIKSKPPMPTWLKNQLIDKGVWNADGINRKARLQHHSCGLLVLTGLDADTCAWPATCDPTWLTPLGEALALINGTPTYDYWIHAKTIDGPRTAQRITWLPAADTGSTRVLPAHTCGGPNYPRYDIPTPTPKDDHDDAPF